MKVLNEEAQYSIEATLGTNDACNAVCYGCALNKKC